MLNSNRIYWTSVEFKLKKTHSDFKKLKGGFVYAFVISNDSESALNKFKNALDENDLVGIDFEYIEPYEDVKWEEAKDNTHYDELSNEASKCNEVIFDDYYMYEDVD